MSYKDKRSFIIIFLIFIFLFLHAYALPWDSPEVKARKLVDKLEKFASELDGVDIAWNPTYAGLAKEITEIGPVIVPILIEEVLDTTNAWNFRYLCVDRLLFIEGMDRENGEMILDAYLKIMRNEDEIMALRKNAIDAISRLAGTRSLMGDSLRLRFAEELTEIAVDVSRETVIRLEVIGKLTRFAKHYGDVIVEPLFKCTNDPSGRIRAASLGTLITVAGFGYEKDKVGSILVEKLKVEEHRILKDEILFGIKVLKVQGAIPLLMESLETGKYCSKSQAAELLGIMEVKRAVPLLIKALKEVNAGLLRCEAAEALGEIGDKRAVEPLIEVLLNDNLGAYLDAAEALGKIGDKKAIKPLMERLSRINFHPSLVQALIRLEAREAIPLIEEKMPKGRLYGSDAEVKENLEKFKRGEKLEWEE